MNPKQVRHEEVSKSPSTEQPGILSGAAIVIPPGYEAWAHVPLVPKYEFQRKHEAVFDRCFSIDDWKHFGIAWTAKRVTEAFWDLGQKGFDEEKQYTDSTAALFDSPGFKALPVSVQNEFKEFLAIEPEGPRRFGPSIHLQRKIDHNERCRRVPVVSYSKA